MSMKKFDGKKPDLSMLPVQAKWECARVLMAGAEKYDRDNWRSGQDMEWSRLLAAAQRHIDQFTDGEDTDPETNTLHIANAIVNLMFLTEFYYKKRGIDNRYKGNK